ncbi:MAG: putative manganese-dependent inorganic diphosphatase [Verrucomicrobiota bacterium]
MQTIVIGHRNPDMDSICAAIGYAEFKRLTGMKNVVAARAGSTNERIDFVLEKFGVQAPVFISDLSPRVCDVMERDVVSITADSSVYEAVQLIERRCMRGLPVIDGQFHCLGLLSAFKVLHHLVPSREETATARVVTASLDEIVHTFAGRVILGEPEAEVHDYLLLVGAMAEESFRNRLQRYDGRDVILIVGDRAEIQLAAVRGGVSAMVVTGDTPLVPEVRSAAQVAGVTVITSPYDTATTVLLARGAVKVGRQLDRDFLSFSPDTLLEAAWEQAAPSTQFGFPVLEDDRLVGVLSKVDFLKTVPRQLILVDHNELSQAVAGADKVPIVEILDHHRLGGFSSDNPILFWNNPVGSTSSIVTLCFRQLGLDIPKPIAGLLMAGLISDTLNLTSPTATRTDRQIMEHLAGITGVDPTTLAEEIFSVGSPLLTMSPDQAITADCKEYTEGGVRFSVAQIEELSFTHFEEKQEALVAALDKHCRSNGYFFSALLVTDINTQISVLLLCGSEAFLHRIDFPQRGHNRWELAGVVSRKKQLLPYLLSRLHGLEA